MTDGSALPAEAPAGAFIAQHCVRCHEGDRPEGRFSLEPSRRKDGWLSDALARIDARDMPPDGEPRPDEAEYASAAASIRLALGEVAVAALEVPVRRLTRDELRRAVRDIFGVDEPSIDSIPHDDIGHGFDNSADVQRAPPLWLERVVELAERIAARVVRDPGDSEPMTWTFGPGDLAIEGTNGATGADSAVLFSNGAAVARIETSVGGRARIAATVSGQQAGDQHVRIDIRAGGRRAASFDVPQRRDDPGKFACEIPLAPGRHDVEVRFTNDYHDKSGPAGANDRNCNVHSVSVTCPIDAAPPTPFEEWLAAAAGPSDMERVAALVARAWRLDAADAQREAHRICEAAPEGDDPLRFAVVAAIANPRFLYAGSAADRLALFIWSSLPDDELLRAWRAGDLAREHGIAEQVTRMLADPRASALAERFAVQWLQIGRLADARPDPQLFDGVDRALLDSMRAETVLYVDALIREGRPIDELLKSDFGFMDERLARHYGVAGVQGSGMRRVPLPGGGGVLKQASVLTSTSHPTATSPVKRGKWVMEVLLDAPPPPAPPGVPALQSASGGRTLSMREALAVHRADPNCASCHVVMDAIGLAFESRDATGRRRVSAGGSRIDDSTMLPDGAAIRGIDGVAAWIRHDPRFARAVVRHLAVYALGRGLRPEDGAAIDAAVDSVRREPTLWHAVHRVAQLLREAS